MNVQPAPQFFAEVAASLVPADVFPPTSFAEMSFAIRLAARYLSRVTDEGEELMMTLPPGCYRGTEHALAEWRHHTAAVQEASQFLLALSGRETEVRALLAHVEPKAEQRVWRKLIDFVKTGRTK